MDRWQVRFAVPLVPWNWLGVGEGLPDPPLPLPLLRAEFAPQATLGLSLYLLISVYTPGPWLSPLLGPNP